MKKILAIVLAVMMIMTVFAGCQEQQASGAITYTYNYAMSEFPTVWSPHTYQTATDGEITDYISTGFYAFDYNETKDGYKVVPHMTTDEHPVDVTSQYVGKYGVAEGDKAKVYIINLRDDLKWEDGSKITAHDFVESAKLLLNPEADNYRADSLYSGNMIIVNAMLYAKQGSFVEKQDNNLSPVRWTLADFTKGEDGIYRTPQGEKVYIGTNIALDWLGGDHLADYVNDYGAAYFDTTTWADLTAKEEVFTKNDKDEVTSAGVPLTDENLALFVPVIANNPNWGESADNAPDYFVYDYTYGDMKWEDVGVFALDDTKLCIALESELEGFYLKYSLTSSWLVHVPTYKACESTVDGVYTNTYCTTADNTMSYGPYKLTYFEKDKQFKLTKNEHYFDLSEGTYQTTDIVVDHIKEASGRLEAFNKGLLDSYGLTKEDMEDYSLSDHCYYSTGDSTFAMTFNPDFDALKTAQANAGENVNKTILTLIEFRQAMSFAMDRAKFCLATSPLNAPAFGLYSSLIVSDPEAGTAYRTTDVAKNVLAQFWGVANEYGEGKLYANIDEAIASITGYNLTKAKQLFDAAYDKAIQQGLMDADDKVVIMVGTPNNTSTFYNNGYEFIVNNYTEAVKGTKLEGKLEFTRDDTLGNAFSDALKNNTVDMLFGVGWTGSALDPYGLMEAYVKPSYQYDDSTDFTKINCTIKINGVDYTTNVWNWYEIMAGKKHTITAADGSSIEFSCGTADNNPEVRLEILGALEGAVLLNYNFVPLMDDAGANLKGMQVNYYTENYIFGMGFGGLKYYTYNYTDAEWTSYVNAQDGTLNYK
ncbi:MAG: hypothetical protein J6A88_05250 [Oscillospiraceae bacterium]|nr:hypothetical protein [Oscillospiraceae bacterium]